jgi:UDPglucose 6-dehydrogenase
MKLTVVGIGYVGLVAAGCFAEVGNHVVCVDSDAEKIRRLREGEIPIYEPGLGDIVKRNVKAGRLKFSTNLKDGVDHGVIIFLAVGTPSSADGSADISAVLSVSKDIAKLMEGYRIIVTKSTVPVGTYKKVGEVISANTSHPFDYVSNPEFLKEGAAVEDFMKPCRVIVGSSTPAVFELMHELYEPFMMQRSRLLCMDEASAEMCKYAANVMLASRISFMNEMSMLCDEFGADIEKVRGGLGSDGRIGGAFLFPSVGFGGSCFPKDVRALIHMGEEAGCEMTIAKAVQGVNARQQERFSQRVIDYYSGRKGVRLGVWGLAFKAKTDDVRESPAVYCVQRFIESGIEVCAYDPEAGESGRQAIGGGVEIAEDAYAAVEGCDGLVILTDWQEFRTPDFVELGKRLSGKVIFDGRNLYRPDFVRKQGFEYYSVGRG